MGSEMQNQEKYSYHPQGKGLYLRANLRILNIVRNLVKVESWLKILLIAVFTYNTSMHYAIKLTLFNLCLLYSLKIL